MHFKLTSTASTPARRFTPLYKNHRSSSRSKASAFVKGRLMRPMTLSKVVGVGYVNASTRDPPVTPEAPKTRARWRGMIWEILRLRGGNVT